MTRSIFAALLLLSSSCMVYDSSLLGDAGPPMETGPCTKCGKQCTDLTKDPKNCGACGHDCAGLACADSICQPQVLASSLPAPRGIHLDNARVFYSNHGSVSTQLMDKDGNNSSTFGGAQIFPDLIVEQNNVLYWTNESNLRGKILSISKSVLPNESAPPFVVATDLASPSGIVVIGPYVYFTNAADSNVSMGCASTAYVGQLLRCSASSGCLTNGCGIGGPTLLIGGMQEPRGLSGDATSLVWADTAAKKILGCDVKNCAQTFYTYAKNEGGPYQTLLDTDHVYWTNSTSGEVMVCDRVNCEATKHALASGQSGPRRMVIESSSSTIFWTNADGTVRKCGLPDCANVVTLAKGLKGPWGIDVDANWLYVACEGSAGTVSIDGAVVRMLKQ